MSHAQITIERVYSPPEHKEGKWILVDKLWPRGIKKDSIAFDMWLKEIAPSTSLRKWFHQDSNNWCKFAKRYIQELQEKSDLIEDILEMAKDSSITLFYAAKDIHHNHALVLQKVLLSWPRTPEIK
ncbi:uroporphyrin-III methyltransferase [Legionella norrlandica]|uniref:Uroporphyrin-III methyltransferase n=1 Tax=Legionella norrlandica TaxID=1498499 RepID=A0A0A2T9Y9_9GAMM|nr:DUF488 family protein [Legionella norrlandica]KGP64248.1 uroporphyrin-III methyltransferase [Legionella norrlandica]